MSEHPNATIIRERAAALESGDMQLIINGLADDVVWHEIGSGEPLHGKAAVAARWSGIADAGASFTGKLHDVVANDDHAVALVTATVSNGGRSFTYKTAEIYHIRNGKITERWAFSDDTAAINEFFAG